MKRKRMFVTISTITALVFMIITISYGYWTDQLTIEGEAKFEFDLPIINDCPALPEEQTEEYKAQTEGFQEIDPIEHDLQTDEFVTDGSQTDDFTTKERNTTDPSTDGAADMITDEFQPAVELETSPAPNEDNVKSKSETESDPEEAERSVKDESTEH